MRFLSVCESSSSTSGDLSLVWLQLIFKNLPTIVKQHYGTELRSRTLTSVKPEISQSLERFMDEVQASHDSKVLCTAFMKRQMQIPQ